MWLAQPPPAKELLLLPAVWKKSGKAWGVGSKQGSEHHFCLWFEVIQQALVFRCELLRPMEQERESGFGQTENLLLPLPRSPLGWKRLRGRGVNE